MQMTQMSRDKAIAKLKALRSQITSLEREAKSLPLNFTNVDRLQRIQDEKKELEAEFKKINGMIASI